MGAHGRMHAMSVHHGVYMECTWSVHHGVYIECTWSVSERSTSPRTLGLGLGLGFGFRVLGVGAEHLLGR